MGKTVKLLLQSRRSPDLLEYQRAQEETPEPDCAREEKKTTERERGLISSEYNYKVVKNSKIK